MENKTLANWLMGTLIAALGSAFLQMESSTIGFLIFVNWAFVIVAIIKLRK